MDNSLSMKNIIQDVDNRLGAINQKVNESSIEKLTNENLNKQNDDIQSSKEIHELENIIKHMQLRNNDNIQNQQSFAMPISGMLVTRNKKVYDLYTTLVQTNKLSAVLGIVLEKIANNELDIFNKNTVENKLDRLTNIICRLGNLSLYMNRDINKTRAELVDTIKIVLNASEKIEDLYDKLSTTNDGEAVIKYVMENNKLPDKETISDESNQILNQMSQIEEISIETVSNESISEAGGLSEDDLVNMMKNLYSKKK